MINELGRPLSGGRADRERGWAECRLRPMSDALSRESRCPLSGVARTRCLGLATSANDPKQTSSKTISCAKLWDASACLRRCLRKYGSGTEKRNNSVLFLLTRDADAET